MPRDHGLGNRNAIRGVPSFIRSDNGPEFIARRVRQFLNSIDVGTSYIEPGSPWQNGYVESFNNRFRDECLNCEEFTTVQEARVIIEHWRQTYNHRRPHSSLDGLTPAAQRRRTNYPTQFFISVYQRMGSLHCNIEISYLNLGRLNVHWEIGHSMREQDVKLVLQKASEKYPAAKCRSISDNEPQFIAKEFKSFLRIFGLSHARNSPYDPQSNGKLERGHGSLSPQMVEEATRRVTDYVQHYKEVRLHSAIGYVTPADKLAGRADAIQTACVTDGWEIPANVGQKSKQIVAA